MEELALDLLDYCGGSEPTLEQVKKFMQARELKLTAPQVTELITTAGLLLAIP